MTRLLTVLLLCLAVVLPSMATEETVTEEPDLLSVDLNTVLYRFHKAQEGLDTLVADFTQLKSSTLLVNDETSKGRLYYSKPDKFAWAYAEPDDTILLINGDTMVTWYRDLQKAQKMDIASKREKIFKFLAIGQEIERLKENFLITLRAPSEEDPPSTFHLELVPRSRRVRDRLTGMDMWLNATSYLPVRLRYDQEDGDYTVFHLKNLQENTVIEDKTFSIDLPEGVEVDTSLARPSRGER